MGLMYLNLSTLGKESAMNPTFSLSPIPGCVPVKFRSTGFETG